MIIRVPGGQELEFSGGGNLKEALVALDRSLLKTYIAARCHGDTVDLHTPLPADAEAELIPWDGPAAPAIFRHSLSHVMAQAVRRLFPEAQLAIGPAIEDGFYYDFDVERAFTPEDLTRIEQEMGRICKENLRFERFEVPRAEALETLAEAPYKREIVEDL
ncbi:MAG: threonine--tRNA ligase, partial [Candidatus Latescibacterota bacterium]